jgi:hypothetical protein
MNNKRVVGCLAAATAVSALVAVPGVSASGKSHKVSLKCVTPFKKGSSTQFAGTCKGTPWGTVRATGTLHIPHAVLTLHPKGGTATLAYNGKANGAVITAKWKWTKGTGKFKHIKGGGTTKGDFQGNYTYKGTAKY